MRGIWAGDEDMGDGSLQALYAEYIRRCSFVKKVGTSGRSGLIVRDVERLQTEMEEDLEFLTSGAEAANGLYSKAVEGSRSSDRTMMELAWTVVGFEELIKKVRTFQVQLSVFRQMDNDNAFTDLTSLKSNMLSYLKDLFTKKRTAASHILVFMIADELRNRKSYVILVKFMPYKSLTDSKLREMELQVEEAMRNAGMTIVGFTTDGEFNSLRTAGLLQPISVLEIIKMSRNEARHMSPNSIAQFFQLNRQGNPLRQLAAVPVEDVMWMHSLMSHDSVPFERALFILRRKLFFFMHDPHPWIRDKPEELEDVMKSIMAIYLYRRKIEDLKHHPSDPTNFSDYLYQPEKGANGERIHHCEDHNHLLKRIVSHLREGLIPDIDLRYLRDALHDPATGLTYEALTEKNKQSVPDCERLIGLGVISFLERKGHIGGASIIRRIHNWHKAVDGRGLSKEQRWTHCRDMKEWLVSDWMP